MAIAMTPDQARFLLEFLLPQLSSEHSVTKKIFSAVPANQADYRPAPASRSAFELVRHIAVVEIWFYDAVIHRRFGEVPSLAASIKNCQDIAEWYADNFNARMRRLNELSDGDLATHVDFIGLRQDPAVAYLNIAIRHSVHHRGQLSAYLRPMGVPVPAIYVESADAPFSGEDTAALPAEKRPPAF